MFVCLTLSQITTVRRGVCLPLSKLTTVREVFIYLMVALSHQDRLLPFSGSYGQGCYSPGVTFLGPRYSFLFLTNR